MNVADFRAAMSRLPEPPSDSQPPHWAFWRHQLWELGQSEDVSTFWKWPAVYHTMLVNHFPIGHQLLYLQEDWGRWESVVGDPDNEANQRNLVNQAYHLRKWEQATGRRIVELDSILEFGGGYGAMALVARRLGFKGDYAIHDLPEFALLQQWWLGTQGLEVRQVDNPQMVTDLEIAIYSLSETPLNGRNAWMTYPESYLLLCSGMWVDMDNNQWMADTVAAKDYMRWELVPFPGRPDAYLIGWPK